MKNKPIIILNGEPNSIFLEILFKSLKKKNHKSPIILVSSYELIKFYMKKLKFNKKINLIDFNNFNKKKLVLNSINLINVKFKLNKNWNKISKRSNKFIYQSFDVGLKLLNKGETYKFINGPISKKNFALKFYKNLNTDIIIGGSFRSASITACAKASPVRPFAYSSLYTQRLLSQSTAPHNTHEGLA